MHTSVLNPSVFESSHNGMDKSKQSSGRAFRMEDHAQIDAAIIQ